MDEAALKRIAERIAERKRLGMSAEEFDKEARRKVALAAGRVNEAQYSMLASGVRGEWAGMDRMMAEEKEAMAVWQEAVEYARKYGAIKKK